ncbi:unnamed protein product [Prorocentrum cordatum]|uniref:Uncharacterized protein n=1 Tax=Prorocentrum cordatum TaxID=2364126 RepID=A0ABN9TNP4_9DINO|nr:unnamed protein product [Polarella glacialis]
MQDVGSASMPGDSEGDAASCPRSMHVVGRSAGQENHDICGEYVHVGQHHGFAVYQKLGSATAIRYLRSMHRWVIDRAGVRESDVCVAWANDSVGSIHPARADLIWHVWDVTSQVHVMDANVVTFSAPAKITLVGRAANRENASANGEYTLAGVCHSRPLYQHRNGTAVLRFHSDEGRWLLSSVYDSGNVCCAFAEGDSMPHPGFPELQWHFWEPQVGKFSPDPATRTLTAPRMLHVMGRSAESGNARICGTYYLAGAWEGRSLYVQPGTQTVIRYSGKTDRWLIDCEGLAEPSLMSKLYHWILTGDTSAASERCTAHSQACGTQHPGFCDLQWQVWDTLSGRHNRDLKVRATTAPLAVRIAGRLPASENSDINGDYVLQTTHLGRPAYQKVGGRAMIRFWPPSGRWVIDREGLRNTDSCVAYADSPQQNSDHPPTDGAAWYVWETSRGGHFLDQGLAASVPADAPTELPPPAPAAGKRGLAAPPVVDQKRRRLDAADAAEARARRPDGLAGQGWLPRIFGGA